MRFYDLVTKTTTVSNGYASTPGGNFPTSGTTSGVAAQWTSFPNGVFDPGALDIVFDLQIVPGHTPSGATVISVHGVSLDYLRGAVDFTGSSLSLYAGMVGGLPLSANQPKPGLLIDGVVLGAFGNWQGTEQTLDILVNPSSYSHENPGNIVFQWESGQSFSAAITQTLQTAWPSSTVSVTVNPALTTDQTILHICSTSYELALFIHDLTYQKSTMGTNYPGVSIYFKGSKIIVTDYYKSAIPTIALNFDDIIGQPTWIEPPLLTINTIMRADIEVGSYITLPTQDIPGPGSVVTLPTISGSQFGNKLNFSGTFYVQSIRAVGQFRGLGQDDWISVIKAYPLDL